LAFGLPVQGSLLNSLQYQTLLALACLNSCKQKIKNKKRIKIKISNKRGINQ
jgi:hypothetical protein